jgi:HlyD family secretion protein
MFMTIKRKLALFGTLAIGATILTGFGFKKQTTNELTASGTIEARNIRVGSKTGGRVARILVREGDRVHAGQVLATFDDAEMIAVLGQASARIEGAKATLAKLEKGFRPEEIAEARAQLAQAEATAQETVRGYRAEEIGEANAERDRAIADEKNAKSTYDRYEDLLKDGVISRQQRDDAQARWQQAVAVLDRANQQLSKLKSGNRPETIASAKARQQQAEASLSKMQNGYRAEEIAAAKAELALARTSYEEILARNAEARILAPANAVVEVLDARPGDLVAPNIPIFTLLEESEVFVKVYVPETKIGLVELGQDAKVTVDSFPGRSFPAVVEQINQKAEFLPRNVQTREERAHQVIAVKLRIQDGKNIRAGMSADVQISLQQRREGGI